MVSIYQFFSLDPTKAKEEQRQSETCIKFGNIPGPFVAILIGRHNEDDGLSRIIFNGFPHEFEEEPSIK